MASPEWAAAGAAVMDIRAADILVEADIPVAVVIRAVVVIRVGVGVVTRVAEAAAVRAAMTEVPVRRPL
jgi:hypothetical protein